MERIKKILKSLFRRIYLLPFLGAIAATFEFRKKLRNKGRKIWVKGSFDIEERSFLTVGNRVCIGRNSKWSAPGGIVIGDNTHIGDRVRFETIEEGWEKGNKWFRTLRPILLGRGVEIGDDVIIGPGTVLEDGVKIPSGTKRPLSTEFPTTAVHKNRSSSDFLSGREKGGGLFFILSTGRCGSRSIAKGLSSHSSIRCEHESKPQLIRISSEAFASSKGDEEIARELYFLFNKARTYGFGKQGESDHRASVLIPYLHRILPEAKFIWLIRNGKDFVASAYSRGWFSDEELGYGFGDKSVHTGWKWAAFRPEGHMKGSMTREEWKEMTPFERNCWYWSEWNQNIEEDLETLPSDRWTMVRLEELEEKVEKLQNFIGVTPEPVRFQRVNKGDYKKLGEADWSKEQTDLFEKWCGDQMRRWYG